MDAEQDQPLLETGGRARPPVHWWERLSLLTAAALVGGVLLVFLIAVTSPPVEPRVPPGSEPSAGPSSDPAGEPEPPFRDPPRGSGFGYVYGTGHQPMPGDGWALVVPIAGAALSLGAVYGLRSCRGDQPEAQR